MIKKMTAIAAALFITFGFGIKTAIDPVSENTEKYIVKIVDNRVCVLQNGEIYTTLTVQPNVLGQYDRERFEEGVPLESDLELAQLMEDFAM